jgi:hypothetical protein
MNTSFSSRVSGLLVLTGALMLFREAVFYFGFYLLGSSINWPNSLGLSADETFRLITEHSGAVFSGYYVYLLSSVLFVPIAFVLRAVLRTEKDAVTNTVLDIATAFAVISVVFRAMGILRWLFAMPMLAATYLDPASTPAMREAALLNFNLLDTYAGKAGEHLGVGLFAAFFVFSFGIALWRTAMVPRFYAGWALIAALLFIPFPDILGFDGGALLFVSGFTFSFWVIFLGMHLLRKGRELQRQSSISK